MFPEVSSDVPPEVSGRRRLLTNAGLLAVGGVLAQVAFVAIEAKVARELGVAAYGTFSAVYAITLLLTIAVDMGMNWKLIEEGSRDPRTLGVNLGTMIGLKLLIFAAMYPLVLGIFAALGTPPPMYRLFAVMAFFGLLMTVQDSLAAVYTATHRNGFNALFQTAVPAMIFAAFLLLVPPAPSLLRTGAAYVAGSAVVTLVWIGIARREIVPTLAVSRFKATIAGSYLYGLTSLLSYASFRSGVLLLTVFSTAREVALFAAAFKLVELGYKIPILANRLAAPYLFAGSKHRPEEFPRLCRTVLRAAAAVSVSIGLIVFLAGDEAVRLIFGPAFAQTAPLVRIVGISLALKTFCLLAQAVVTAADRLVFRTRAVGIATAVSAIASIALIPHWGALGAAYGVLIGDVLLLALLLSQLRKVS